MLHSFPSGSLTSHRRSLNVFVLAMLSLAVVISLRNLPLTAEYGLSSIFYYVAAAVLFMIPYALVAAELASGWPKSGGIYIWVREALGERWGFFAIWMQWFHNVTWYPAMLAFIGAGIAYLFNPELANNKIYLLSVILIGFWGVTLINFLGIKTSAWMSTVCVIIGAIVPGAILILLGLYWVVSGHPLAISLSLESLKPDLGTWGNLVFFAGIFLALSGLEANANLAREVKNPQKNYPKAIFIAALLTLGILILGSIAIALVIPKENISLVSGLLDAFASFFNTLGLSWLVPIIATFTVLGALGELNAWAMAGVRGLFVTTEHGSLPPFFHKLNKHSTPVRLMVFQGIIVTIAAFAFLFLPNINVSYWVLSVLSAQMYIITYVLLFIAGIVLRYRKPHVVRAYKVPGKNVGIWICALLGFLSCIFAFLIGFVPPKQFVVGSLLKYEVTLISGIIIACAIPLVIHALRKPHWQKKVLKEIREEIRKSVK